MGVGGWGCVWGVVLGGVGVWVGVGGRVRYMGDCERGESGAGRVGNGLQQVQSGSGLRDSAVVVTLCYVVACMR